MAKKSSKAKLKNKHQNKQSKGRKKKKSSLNKPKNQSVTIQRKRQSSEQISDPRSNFHHGLLNGDASLEDIDHLIDESGAIRSLSGGSYWNDDGRPLVKRKKTTEVEEQEYENQPRKLKQSYFEDDNNEKGTVPLLPIKTKDGLIQRTKVASDKKSEDDNVQEHDTSEEVPEVENVQPELTMIEVYAKREEMIRDNKASIARLCEEILENPDSNINNLKKLLEYCNKEQILIIQKLAIISLCEIFKDIAPGYRIRPLSEQEKSVRVSKDVRKLRDFEEGLVISYKKYLDILEELLQSFVKKKTKKKIQVKDGDLSKAKVSCGLASTAAKCMSELLLNLNHFNYRTNLIVAVVSRMHLDGEKKEIGDIFIETIKSLFKNDEIGDVSIEALKVISRVMKSKISQITPEVLETLLHLNINSQMVKEAESRETKIERIRRRKEEIRKMSRNERKRKKMETKLDKELQETEAVESRQKLQRYQTDILKTLFVIYFRVLKQEKRTALLTPVLKGLSKFAHLINVEFFSDLMKSLTALINSGELSLTESLNCVLTSFKILSGQGESLNIDLHHFYLHLYNSLVNIGADCDPDDLDLCTECLDIMLLKRRKQISLRRILGFLKRMATISMQLDSENLFAFMGLIRGVLQLNQKCDILLDNESMGRGVFQPELADPEHCNADSTALWELLLLSKHYCLDTRDYAQHLLKGAPSQGQGALPKRLIQRKSYDRTENLPLEYYFPANIPSSKGGNNTKFAVNKWNDSCLKDQIEEMSSLTLSYNLDYATFIGIS